MAERALNCPTSGELDKAGPGRFGTAALCAKQTSQTPALDAANGRKARLRKSSRQGPVSALAVVPRRARRTLHRNVEKVLKSATHFALTSIVQARRMSRRCRREANGSSSAVGSVLATAHRLALRRAPSMGPPYCRAEKERSLQTKAEPRCPGWNARCAPPQH
jgi:hypothetical protein